MRRSKRASRAEPSRILDNTPAGRWLAMILEHGERASSQQPSATSPPTPSQRSRRGARKTVKAGTKVNAARD
jgi:hypothetical protein